MVVELFQPAPRTYRIGHLTREFGVTPRTLRYYEELGLLAPGRQDGARRYSGKDRDRLIFILQGRAVGLPLVEVARLLDLREGGANAVGQEVEALSIFKGQLVRLEARRDVVEQGISLLRSAIEQLSAVEQSRGPGREASAPPGAKRPAARDRRRWASGPPPRLEA